MTKLNATQIVIPSFLHHRDPCGYEAKRSIERWTRGYWSINYGSIYHELQRSEKEGFIEGRIEEKQGSPHRKIYATTDEGNEEFEKMMREGLEREPIVKDKFNALAAFFDRMDGREAKAYFEEMEEK